MSDKAARGLVGDERTDERTEAVREHLASILASEEFRGSERCKKFLNFVVVRTLEGKQSEIKERTIGIEVFGRRADYDTSGDAIVRVKATEIRNRLARYYQKRAHQGPLRIDIASGSYIPIFRWQDASDRVVATSTVDTPGDGPAGQLARSADNHRKRGMLIVGVSAAALLALALLGLLARSSRTALDEFWEPVVRSREQPIISLPKSNLYALSEGVSEKLRKASLPQQAPLPFHVAPGEVRLFENFHVSVPELQAALGISTLLSGRGRQAVIRPGAELRPDEIQRHPVIAIGHNQWAVKRASEWRFWFRVVPSEPPTSVVQDRLHPEIGWRVDGTFPLEKQTVDYAVVTRTIDSSTGSVFISVSGITSFGCQAAGEFLIDPQSWALVARDAPKGWQRKNLQIALRTDIVGRTPTRSKVLAMHFW